MRRTVALSIWVMLWTVPAPAPGGSLADDNPQAVRLVQQAQEAFAREDYGKAARLYGKVASTFAASEQLAERAQFLEAEARYRDGSLVKAYRLFEKLLKDFPRTQYFDDVIEREYQIGGRFCSGTKRRVMGIFRVRSGDLGVSVLEQMIQHAPQGPYADEARMRIAAYHLGRRRDDEAREQYDLLLREHPDSPLAPDARLLRAQIAQRKVRGPRYNAGDLVQAELELLEAKSLDRGKPTEGEIDAALGELREKQLRSEYETAKFYLRQGQAAAAAICLRGLIQRAPDSPYARYAQAALAELAEPGEADE